MNIEGIKRYVEMQKRFYNGNIIRRGYQGAKEMVGCPCFAGDGTFWRNWLLYNKKYERGLDFACGVGRLIAWFYNNFEHIDGVDLSEEMLKCATRFLNEKKVPFHKYSLHLCNGWNLENFESNVYDVVYSSCALHHICVWEIRNNFFKEFYRILKPSGLMSIQMMGGTNFEDVTASKWYDNVYDATITNSGHDVKLENPYYLAQDLYNVGYHSVNITIAPAKLPNGAGKHEYTMAIKALK